MKLFDVKNKLKKKPNEFGIWNYGLSNACHTYYRFTVIIK